MKRRNTHLRSRSYNPIIPLRARLAKRTACARQYIYRIGRGAMTQRTSLGSATPRARPIPSFQFSKFVRRTPCRGDFGRLGPALSADVDLEAAPPVARWQSGLMQERIQSSVNPRRLSSPQHSRSCELHPRVFARIVLQWNEWQGKYADVTS